MAALFNLAGTLYLWATAMRNSAPHPLSSIRNRMGTHPSVVLTPGNLSITRTRSVENGVLFVQLNRGLQWSADAGRVLLDLIESS